ncbi:unnamed protein product [Rotaria magnacalcarata]|uniref:RING-type domain-containing protein n=5 Tax=Rotaria magnacalcarata TaxID=392030 RepID=A0A816MN51_9BILA|nr:unnamed protein product [Rotaria magnacalcarata]CAF1982043.1 unnamed protein product [Rotaria magnacalcarata]CAF2008884.1 unnamed protein product [Rotaria magnacalcarata]CAF2148337.1 unnamed protein product [Rotaria magnacalcarata]CAF4031724.1 unnamed protein product [Rotaria magnacalcarata]
MNIACTICLDRFFLSSIISASPCGHLFHDKCLDRWLVDERKKTCPQCRTPITPKQVLKKLYLMEPLCQTQLPSSSHDSSDLLNQLDAQETKILECEQRCRKALSDLQKSEERRQAFENDAISLRKQFNEQTNKHQRTINERDAKINMLLEQYKHIDLSNKKDEQIKSLQAKLAEYRNIELIYKGLASTFKAELQKMVGSCQTIQDKDRVMEELIRYNVILKEEHCKMSDDKQDLIRNLDRITAQCEKMQLEKRQVIKRQSNATDNSKQELASVRQQLESYQSRINQLESLLLRTASPDARSLVRRVLHESPLSDSVTQKVRVRLDEPSKSNPIPLTDDESSKDDEIDSNMIDLTNVPDQSSSLPFSTQQFSTATSAIDILHSIIQETSSSLDLPTMKKMKVRKLDDDIEENDDYLVRPLVRNENNFQRSFNKFGGHSIPITRRLSSTTFKSKPKSTKLKRIPTKNNHKITTFFDLN